MAAIPSKDWVSDRRTYALAWGAPTAALVVSVVIGAPQDTIVWTAALTWMGIACLVNARRCGRTHCYLTGPFFLLMAAAGLLHGLGTIPLGADGWIWLLAVTLGGAFVLLWWLPERLLGKYVASDRSRFDGHW